VEDAGRPGTTVDDAAGPGTAAARGTGSAVAGAGGVVFGRDGRVLVLGHVDGAWVFPKGHIEEGETSEAAALREVEEEAGVDAELVSGAPSWTTRYRNSRGVPRLITWYACTTDATAVVLTERVFPRGGFFEPARALDLLTHPSDKDLLKSVLEVVRAEEQTTR
jgi:diadenosine hexaphosphate hydrolase (ATP-forming)